jgi:hypothetical protein
MDGILSIDIRFLCTACGSKLRIDAAAAGRHVTCSRCGKATRVPSLPSSENPGATVVSNVAPAASDAARILSAELRFFCPACQGKLRVEASAAGQAMSCVLCQAAIQVPVLPDWVHRIGMETEAPPESASSSDAVRASLLTPDEIDFLTRRDGT